MNQPPEQWLEQAKNFLLNRNFTIEEIAVHLGFASAGEFNAAFETEQGESPQAYRDRIPS